MITVCCSIKKNEDRLHELVTEKAYPVSICMSTYMIDWFTLGLAILGLILNPWMIASQSRDPVFRIRLTDWSLFSIPIVALYSVA